MARDAPKGSPRQRLQSLRGSRRCHVDFQPRIGRPKGVEAQVTIA